MTTYPPTQFDPPRWPGGPFICIAANLPSFETVAAAKKVSVTMAGDNLAATWTCQACGLLHAEYHDANRKEHWTGPGMLAARRFKVLEIERPI